MKLKQTIKGGVLVLLLLSGLLPSAAWAQVSAILVDPLEKVFPETIFPNENFKEIDVARGEVASAQLVLRSAQNKNEVKLTVVVPELSDAKISYGPVGYVRAERSYTEPAVDRLVSNTGFYPDPILDKQPIKLQAGVTQACFLTIPIPKETKAGSYEVKISVHTGDETIQKSFLIHVHNIELEKQRLWVTNWYSLDPKRLMLLNKGEKVKPFGEVYWKLIKVLADKMGR